MGSAGPPEVLSFNLATACGRVGNAKRKRELLERVLEIEERHYGKEHFEVAITLTNLAIAHGRLGDPKTMRKLLKRALRMFEEGLGNQHPHTKFVRSILQG